MDVRQTILKVHDLVTPISNDWLLIGTTSLYLQEYEVDPHDIDILCSTREAQKIAEALSTYNLPLDAGISRDKFRSDFSRYRIDGVDIELMGDLEINTANGWVRLLDNIDQTEIIELEGRLLIVPSVKDQVKIYHLFGREKDRLIAETLLNG